MTGYAFTLRGAELVAMPSGALYWPEKGLICVSDLHLGKAARRARLSEALLPPYETRDTLARLESELRRTDARQVVCLGDSFDNMAALASLPQSEKLWLATLQDGRRWIWIEGNHDPGPIDLGGTHVAEFHLDSITFRHIAVADKSGEISGHYHPKARLNLRGSTVSRPAFLIDHARVILPAFGTYTGGLRSEDPALSSLMADEALAVFTGKTTLAFPMPRQG